MSVNTSVPVVEGSSPRAVVIRTVTNWLESGRLRPGEPLPSARSLSRQLRIDPRTVGVALDMLEEGGRIQRRANGRRIVNAVPQGTTGDSFLSNAVVLLASEGIPAAAQTLTQPGWSLQLELAARAAIQSRGHHFVVFNLTEAQQQLHRLVREQPLGVIVADPEHVEGDLASLLHEAAKDRMRVAVYGDTGPYEVFDRVVSDHVAGSHALTLWLVRQGRRKPLLLLPEGETHRPWVQQRRKGYEQACHEAGIEPLPPIELPRMDEGWGDPNAFDRKKRLVAGYLAEHLTGRNSPDALLAASDGPAFAVAAACRLLHRRVHEDVMIVGYDNYWEGSPERQFEPFTPAATVDKRNDLIGRALVEMLSERVAGSLSDAPQCRVIEPELLVNKTTQLGAV